MRRIHQLFSDEFQESVRQLTIARGLLSLCWHPIAGSECPDRTIGKFFLLHLEMEIVYQNRLIRIPVPILYFIAENLMFLTRLLFHHQLRVNTLIHIKEESDTMGGSWIPNHFIYQAASALKLQRVVCDESPQNKKLNIYDSHH